MRVLLVIDQFYDVMGGTEQHLLFLCRNLPKAGIDVQLVVLTDVRRCGIDVFDVPVRVLWPQNQRFGLGFLRRVWRLAEYVKSEKIDVIQSFCPVSEVAAVLAAQLGRRSRVVGCRRNTGYWHTFWTRWRTRLFGRFVHHFVANSEAAKHHAVDSEWIPRRRVTVIHNPVDMLRMQLGFSNPETPGNLNIQSGEGIVAMVATVRPIKDHETFLRAAKIILHRHPHTRFLVIGDAKQDYRDTLVRLSQHLQIDRQVTWVGAVVNTYRLLPWVHVGVLTSLSEGYSNALLEYAAAGIPSVATNVGGNVETIEDGITGFLVPPKDPVKLADRIIYLLEHPDEARRLGDAAKQRAFAENSPEQVIDRYLKVYTQLHSFSEERHSRRILQTNARS
jgi:L-malate glycosyltransferase